MKLAKTAVLILVAGFLAVAAGQAWAHGGWGHGFGMGQGMGQGMGPGYVDQNGDGICDNRGTGRGRMGGQGMGQRGAGNCPGPNYTDENKNGICDYREGLTATKPAPEKTPEQAPGNGGDAD